MSAVAERALPAFAALQRLCTARACPGLELKVVCNPALTLHPSRLARVEAIVEEALANAAKHAFAAGRPGRVWITLDCEHGRCRLSIRDSGPGFPELAGRAVSGLARIERMAADLGGYCRLDNRNYGGAEVAVTFPIAPADLRADT